MTKPVIVYRTVLLHPSETFVLTQAESLKAYTPKYVGCRTGPLRTPIGRTYLIGGRPRTVPRETLFKLFGIPTPAVRADLADLGAAALHAHFGEEGVRCMPLAKTLGLPLVVTFHGLDATISDRSAQQMGYTFRRYLRRRGQLAQDGARFIAVCDFIAQRLLCLGFPENKILVHYIGVDTTRFQRQSNVREQRPTILFVGRLVEKKGLEYLIAATKLAQRHVPDLRLVVIGDGPRAAMLRKFATEHASGAVEFHGSLPHEAVRGWMERAWVLAVPSVTASTGDSEGLPTVVAEASALETPVVAFAHAGLPEIIVDGQTGVLVPERDVAELAAALTTVLTQDQYRNELGVNAAVHIRNCFNLASQASLLEDIYSGLEA